MKAMSPLMPFTFTFQSAFWIAAGSARPAARIPLLILRLPEDQRRLLDRCSDKERVAARGLDLGELRRKIRRLRVHGLHDADLYALALQHLGELLRRAQAEIVVGGEEVGLL